MRDFTPNKGKFVEVEFVDVPYGSGARPYALKQELGRLTGLDPKTQIGHMFGSICLTEFFWKEEWNHQKISTGLDAFLNTNPTFKIRFREKTGMVI